MSELYPGLELPSAEVGIHIIGLGVNEIYDTPLFSFHLLTAVDRIFYLGQSDFSRRILRDICQEFEDLAAYYLEGMDAHTQCRVMAGRVIDSYKSNRIALAVNGDPLFLNTVSDLVVAGSEAKNIPSFVYSAPSSLSGVLSIAGAGSLSNNVLVCTEKTLNVDNTILNPENALAVFQMGNSEPDDISLAAGQESPGFTRILEKIKSAYGLDCYWIFTRLACEPNGTNLILEGNVRDLHLIGNVNRSGTLFIYPER